MYRGAFFARPPCHRYSIDLPSVRVVSIFGVLPLTCRLSLFAAHPIL